MYDISKLPKSRHQHILQHLADKKYKLIGQIFLHYGVTNCDSCATDYTSIRKWCEYWKSQNILIANE